MKRKLVILTSVISLLFCIAFSFFWVRSHYRWDAIDWYRNGHCLQIRSADGTLCVQHGQKYALLLGDFSHIWHQAPPEPFDWTKSKIPYTDVIGIITPEMSFWDRFWWHPGTVFRRGGFAVYKSTPVIFMNQEIAPAEPGCWALETPYWFWCAIAAIMPAWVMAKLVGRFYRRRGNRC